MKKLLLLILLIPTVSFSQATRLPSEIASKEFLYKKVDTTNLYLELLYSTKDEFLSGRPAMVFFFGGGWEYGNRDYFRNHAEYFAERGLVCFLVDYRIKHLHETTPFESLKDAKSAIRFIRKNADHFGINPSKIIATGASAGGHLASATALIHDYNEKTDDFSISCIPNALALFSPVVDNSPGGYGYNLVREEYKRFSPLYNIRKGAPPTILLVGSNDGLIPLETVKYYKIIMEKLLSRCDLIIYEDQGHGFFKYSNFYFYKKSLLDLDAFLQSLGYLNSSTLSIKKVNQ